MPRAPRRRSAAASMPPRSASSRRSRVVQASTSRTFARPPSAATKSRAPPVCGAGAGPVYIAILPIAAEQEAGGSPDGVLQAIHDALGRKGTYAAVIGRHFRAGSDVLEPGVAGRLATEALAAHRSEGVTATLLNLVDRVAAERSGGNGGGSGGQPSGGGGVVIGLLIAGAVAFLVFRAVRKRRRSQAEQHYQAASKPW